MKKQNITVELFLAALLVACGDSVTTEKVMDEHLSVVSAVAELPGCDQLNEGEKVLVENESQIRVCVDGKWYATVNDTIRVNGASLICFAEKLMDGSGSRIICNGDSVGVVLNGKKGADGIDGADGEMGTQGERGIPGDAGTPGLQGEQGNDGVSGKNGENGKSCSIKKMSTDSIRVVCSLDSVTIYVGEQPDMTDEIIDSDSLILDSEKVAISLDDVSGASQKGPFLSGSRVIAYELEDGRTLKQSGNNFSGVIMNDNGEFNINARTLMSQYLKLEATGYYRNEVSGENSDAKLTLLAITDVSARNVANINLLTHLEYERVNYLVTQEKMKVKAAKKQAQKEVFGLLLIDATGFSNSEDLNVAGTSEEDAALLAFSVLLQGNRKVSELSELLTKIADDMEKDGAWDDETTKLAIADWAAQADVSGRLDSIRNNVKKWGLSSMVPDFEKYIRHFWTTIFGLGECTKDSVGIVKGTNYICKEIDSLNEIYRWVTATTFEKDTYDWEPGEDGERRCGFYDCYLYDALIKHWREYEEVEIHLGMCTESVEKDDSKNTGSCPYGPLYGWYKCENRTWVKTTELYVDTHRWNKGVDGDVVKGDSTDAFYVYDDAEGAWRVASQNDSTLGLRGCTKNRAGEAGKSSLDGEYYGCSSRLSWEKMTKVEYENTKNEKCDEEGKMILGEQNTASYFVCAAGVWRAATAGEEQAGSACTEDLEGSLNIDSTMTCENGSFRFATVFDFPVDKDWTNPDKTYGTLVDKRDGRVYKTIEINGLTVMAQNLNYGDERVNPYLRDNNWCYNNDSMNCLKAGRYYSWTAAMNVDPKWNEGYAHDVKNLIGNPHQGICPDGWHIPTKVEWEKMISGYGYKELHVVGNPHWGENYYPATNTSGLSLQLTGYLVDGSYAYPYISRYWTASEDSELYAYSLEDNYIGATYKINGMPVRCFKD